MRIDSHQHFWRYRRDEYGWITPDKAALERDFLPADLKPLLDATGFDRTVAVQARQSLEETEWLLSLAETHDFIAGVVGWVDLCSPAVEGQLERFAGQPKLVGVRHVVHDEPDDAFLLRPDFLRGIERVGAFDLVYDLLLFPRHLPVAEGVVRAFPRQRFVVDHLAKPTIHSGEIATWARDIGRLAKYPNVSCKLSGMVTEARRGGWRREDFRAYLDVVTSAFGMERLMIGSDWPVCTLSATYRETMDIVTGYLVGRTPEERAAVLGGNCARIYHLGERKES